MHICFGEPFPSVDVIHGWSPPRHSPLISAREFAWEWELFPPSVRRSGEEEKADENETRIELQRGHAYMTSLISQNVTEKVSLLRDMYYIAANWDGGANEQTSYEHRLQIPSLRFILPPTNETTRLASTDGELQGGKPPTRNP